MLACRTVPLAAALLLTPIEIQTGSYMNNATRMANRWSQLDRKTSQRVLGRVAPEWLTPVCLPEGVQCTDNCHQLTPQGTNRKREDDHCSSAKMLTVTAALKKVQKVTQRVDKAKEQMGYIGFLVNHGVHVKFCYDQRKAKVSTSTSLPTQFHENTFSTLPVRAWQRMPTTSKAQYFQHGVTACQKHSTAVRVFIPHKGLSPFAYYVAANKHQSFSRGNADIATSSRLLAKNWHALGTKERRELSHAASQQTITKKKKIYDEYLRAMRPVFAHLKPQFQYACLKRLAYGFPIERWEYIAGTASDQCTVHDYEATEKVRLPVLVPRVDIKKISAAAERAKRIEELKDSTAMKRRQLQCLRAQRQAAMIHKAVQSITTARQLAATQAVLVAQQAVAKSLRENVAVKRPHPLPWVRSVQAQ